jgi:hypothetical protein
VKRGQYTGHKYAVTFRDQRYDAYQDIHIALLPLCCGDYNFNGRPPVYSLEYGGLSTGQQQGSDDICWPDRESSRED